MVVHGRSVTNTEGSNALSKKESLVNLNESLVEICKSCKAYGVNEVGVFVVNYLAPFAALTDSNSLKLGAVGKRSVICVALAVKLNSAVGVNNINGIIVLNKLSILGIFLYGSTCTKLGALLIGVGLVVLIGLALGTGLVLGTGFYGNIYVIVFGRVFFVVARNERSRYDKCQKNC